jgi:hypothetical protein
VDYLDFEVEILPGASGEYAVNVRSEFGEASGAMRLPFDTLALENRLQALQIALLRSASASRRVASPEEAVVQKFGQELYDALFADGPIRGRFEAARDGAYQRDAGVRVRLRIAPPELAALPWEYLYDPTRDDFLGLSITTPLVRYIPLPRPVRPLLIRPPVRILAMIAASVELPSLDAPRERQRLEVALQALVSRGLVELSWLPTGTWRDLQTALLEGPWHIFHFVGHGGFDEIRGEGFVYLSGEDGRASRLPATSLGRLLGDHDPMRLVILNSCEGARGDNVDVFSSTAATLVKRGTPGVVAMQYPITDRAAIEFSRSFYGAIAAGTPVDTALTVARKSISFEIPGTLEWGTPALFLRASDGVLFVVPPSEEPAKGSADVVGAAPPSPAPTARQPEMPAPDRLAAPAPEEHLPVPSSPAGGPAIDGSVASETGLQPTTASSGSAPAVAQPAASTAPVDVSAAAGTIAFEAPAKGPSERSRLAIVAGALRSGSDGTHGLINRGWQTGHVQTLIGAELGAIGAMLLNLQYVFPRYLNIDQTFVYLAIWISAVSGAAVVLRLAGPPRWWRAVIALALMFPLFVGLAGSNAIYTNFPNLLLSIIVVAILALAASSVVLLRRPGPS